MLLAQKGERTFLSAAIQKYIVKSVRSLYKIKGRLMVSNLLDKRLFSIIKKCYDANFWDFLDSSQLIVIQLPQEKEPIFISTIGQETKARGFLIYRGYKQLAYLYQALNKAKNDHSYLGPVQQNCLAIYFENREILSKEEYQRIKSSHIPFRREQEWPVLVDFKPGFLPVPYEESDFLWLIHALEKFFDTAQDFIDNLSIFDKEEVVNFTAFIGRQYGYDGQYKTKLFEVPQAYREGTFPDCVGRHPIYVSRFEILRAKQVPVKRTIWELDLHQVRTPTEKRKKGFGVSHPYYPLLFIVADEATQESLYLDLIKKDDVAAFQRNLVRLFIKNNVRPTAISIHKKDDSMYAQSYFEEILKELDIDLHIRESLPIIEYIKEALNKISLIEE